MTLNAVIVSVSSNRGCSKGNIINWYYQDTHVLARKELLTVSTAN